MFQHLIDDCHEIKAKYKAENETRMTMKFGKQDGKERN